jgi:hypothetical protein
VSRPRLACPRSLVPLLGGVCRCLGREEAARLPKGSPQRSGAVCWPAHNPQRPWRSALRCVCPGQTKAPFGAFPWVSHLNVNRTGEEPGIMKALLASAIAAGYVNSGQRAYHWAGKPLSACLWACGWDRSPARLCGWQAPIFLVCRRLAESYHSTSHLGHGASQVSAFRGVDLGSAVVLSGGICRGFWRPLARSRARRITSWGTLWGQ